MFIDTIFIYVSPLPPLIPANLFAKFNRSRPLLAVVYVSPVTRIHWF